MCHLIQEITCNLGKYMGTQVLPKTSPAENTPVPTPHERLNRPVLNLFLNLMSSLAGDNDGRPYLY
jgi:hypothetical protein